MRNTTFRGTLLGDFIIEKLARHVEPERAGTPKGEPIGISLKKYKAICLSLLNEKGKEIAQFLKISHSFFRKWKAETDFKKELATLELEFAEVFCQHVLHECKKESKSFKKHFARPLEEFVKSPQFNYLVDPQISDVHTYSASLKNLIPVWANCRMSDLKDEDDKGLGKAWGGIMKATKGKKGKLVELTDDSFTVFYPGKSNKKLPKKLEWGRGTVTYKAKHTEEIAGLSKIIAIIVSAKNLPKKEAQRIDSFRKEYFCNVLLEIKRILAKPNMTAKSQKLALYYISILESFQRDKS